MKIQKLFRWIATNIALGTITATVGGGSVLAGDSRGKSKLEEEFKDESPLPQEAINIYKKADEYYDKAQKTGRKGYYRKAIQYYDQLYAVKVGENKYINLTKESTSVVEGKSKALDALGYKRQARKLKLKLDELNKRDSS